MHLLKLMTRNPLLMSCHKHVLSKRNVAMDRDNYHIKFPAATITVAGLALCGYILYSTWFWQQRVNEQIINRQPLAERERDPDMTYLPYRSKLWRPKD